MLIRSFRSYLYREVWLITQRAPDGSVKASQNTGKSILAADIAMLPANYQAAEFSTTRTQQPQFDIDLVCAATFT